MEEIFQRIIDNDFSDLAGTTADASIPIPQYLVNEIIEAALQGNKSIRSCQVSIHGQNRISVYLRSSLLPWPLNFKLKLDGSVDLASFSSPKLRACLENNRLLGSLGAFFNALPEWVKLYGDQVVLDIGYFLRTPEQKRMLALVKSVDIRTEEGKAIFDVELRVD